MSMRIIKAVVIPEDAGRKLKYYVRGAMGVSYTQYASLKQVGGVRVNGRAAHANDILRAGDVVELTLAEKAREPIAPDFSPVNVVYEDDDLLVIDKPAPLACQVSAKQDAPTLENRLAARFGPDFLFRPLNRLDRGTSGLLCAAKNAHACQILQKKLHTGDFVREYRAVVCGSLAGEGVIDLPIEKADAASIRRVIDPVNGKRSVTHWRALGVFGAYSLIALTLETGRTHQIRVHMAAIGHPVAGDFLYGTELPSLPGRFALHSARLAVAHPMTDIMIDVKSPLPPELFALIHETKENDI